MDQTQTPAPDAAGTTVTTPQVVDETLAELAKQVPDLEIIENTSPGKQGHVDLRGNVLDEWPVNNAGQRIPEEAAPPKAMPAAGKDAVAPQGAAADGAGGAAGPTPSGGEKSGAGDGSPAPATAPADGGSPREEDADAKPKADDVAAAREAALRVTAEQVQQPSQPPKAEDAPEIDWSDEPDWEDGDKYPTEKDALAARRKYIADKAQEHAKAVAEHQQKQALSTVQATAQENASRAMQARQIEYLRQTQKALGLDDAEFQSRGQDYAMVRHPQAINPVQLPNPVGQLLYQARDQYLMQRAAMGLPVADHESVSEILTEQWRDMGFARKVAAVAPDNPVGGLVVAAVAQLPAPVRMLRHLVTDEGQAQVKEITGLYGDGRNMDAQTYRAAGQQVANRIARLDAGLKDAPPAKAKPAEPKKAVDVAGKEAGAPGRFTAPAPEAPRNAPGATTEGNEHEPFSPEWISAEVRAAKKAAAEAVA